MCVAIAALGLTAMQTAVVGSALAASAISAASAVQQGRAAAQVARNNQVMAGYAAQDAIKRGDAEAMKAQQRARQIVGAQRAGMAAKGLDLGEGTAAELQDQTDFFGQVDAATTRDNARRAAWTARQTGNAAAAQGQFQQANSNLQAFGSVLGGASQVAGQWYSFKTPPVSG